MAKLKRILSLGAGVQSTALLCMSCLGEVEKLDVAVFADTGWEPAEVYKHLEWLEVWSAEHGVPVVRVEAGNVREDALVSQVRGKVTDGVRWASLPYFTANADGTRGQIRRQCTAEYKIQPVERWQRQYLGLAKGQKSKSPLCEQWRGISADEWQRAKPSRVKWYKTRHPLLEKRITRLGCLDWMRNHDLPEPPRSSCVGCPFHSDQEWRRLRNESPEDFADAVEFDKAIRKCGGMRGDVFLHSSLKPLGKIDFDNDVDRGQGLLWQDECEGMCGV